MDPVDSGFFQACICGRTFSHHNAYNYHLRTCKSGKKRLSGALAKARDAFSSRKKRRLEESGQGGQEPLTEGGISTTDLVRLQQIPFETPFCVLKL